MTTRYIVREDENPRRFAELKAAIEAAGGVVGAHSLAHGIAVEEWWTTDGLDENGTPVFVYHYAIRAEPGDIPVNVTVHRPPEEDHEDGR